MFNVDFFFFLDLDGRLSKGESLVRGQGLFSLNGRYYLAMQKDGNLVLYKNGLLLWSTKTTTGVRFAMETNGNAVLYDSSNRVLFSTSTTNEGDHLELLDNGNMVVLDSLRKTLWASDTYQGRISRL